MNHIEIAYSFDRKEIPKIGPTSFDRTQALQIGPAFVAIVLRDALAQALKVTVSITNPKLPVMEGFGEGKGVVRLEILGAVKVDDPEQLIEAIRNQIGHIQWLTQVELKELKISSD